MANQPPLTGVVLVNCAKANAKSGPAIAARQCGYGDDTAGFEAALTSACAAMGVSIVSLDDLVTDQTVIQSTNGIEVAPDSSAQL